MIGTPAIRRLLLIGCGLGALQQLVGMNAVTYYAPSVLKNIGFTYWAAVAANLLISIVGLAMTVVLALVVVDRYCRRRPLRWGVPEIGREHLSKPVTNAHLVTHTRAQ